MSAATGDSLRVCELKNAAGRLDYVDSALQSGFVSDVCAVHCIHQVRKCTLQFTVCKSCIKAKA